MDILILGGAGQVGTQLQAFPWPDRQSLDITDEATVAAALDAGSYPAVINTAAYTAVAKTEGEVVAAWLLNALAPAILAAETKRRGIPLVHVSTEIARQHDATSSAPSSRARPGAAGASCRSRASRPQPTRRRPGVR
ncbi:hypothetical protein LNAOJCKE_2262 [Methylorubrum aminovorans]|uniref:dTDP-4-dehydrorhamnose reductase n=1 Tax=Methylorubrum aminovorans TaxID=269069 RepID=A0ABQ4UCK7_9HYPH|nr:hypothetical protein LNAOJCKE_2262 [Methylorubrum aminovorans]GMA74523.1 hypothetical protein GCM10025880_09400 [Methylorubrum aminovorans]